MFCILSLKLFCFKYGCYLFFSNIGNIGRFRLKFYNDYIKFKFLV